MAEDHREHDEDDEYQEHQGHEVHQDADGSELDPRIEPQAREEVVESSEMVGNRPAKNAPVVQPSGQFEDMWANNEGLEATDFLGLNAEIQQPLGYGDDPASIQPSSTGAATSQSWMLDPTDAEEDHLAAATRPEGTFTEGDSESGNWLLDGDGAEAPTPARAGAAGTAEAPQPTAFGGSFVDPEGAPRRVPRVLVHVLAAAGIMSVFGVMWKVVTTAGLMGEPGATVALDHTAVGPVELLSSGDSGGNVRRGINRDGTIEPLAVTPLGDPTGATTTTETIETDTALADPATVDTTPVAVELPPSPEEQEAIKVLAALEALAAEPRPESFRLVTWDDVLGLSLAEDYFDRVTGTERPEFLPLPSARTADAVAGEGPPLPPDLTMPGLEAPMVTTGDGALTELAQEPVMGRRSLPAHLISLDRSVLDQYVSMVMNGDTGGTRFDYVSHLGQRSAFAPGDPFTRATIRGSELYLPAVGPDFGFYIAGDDNLLPPAEGDGEFGGGSISVEAEDLLGIGGEFVTEDGSRRKRLADHWYEERVPREHINRARRLLTPRVGAVRVVYMGDEVFEGRLFAVGEGRIWLNMTLGQITLDGARTKRVDRIALDLQRMESGDPGLRNLAGLPRVRVRVRGGTFIGRQIQREGDRVTLVTDRGYRVTVVSDDIAMAPNQDIIVEIKRRRMQ